MRAVEYVFELILRLYPSDFRRQYGDEMRVRGCGAGATRLMASQLFGVAPSDPATYATVPVVLGAVAGLACYLPARRASRLDPLTALRRE